MAKSQFPLGGVQIRDVLSMLHIPFFPIMSTSLIFDDTSPNFQFSSGWLPNDGPAGASNTAWYNNSISTFFQTDEYATAYMTFYFQGKNVWYERVLCSESYP